MSEDSFYYIFRLPKEFPSEYCFGDGVPVNFQMVDWFGASADVSLDELNAFIRTKRYAFGKLLIMERNGKCWVLETSNDNTKDD